MFSIKFKEPFPLENGEVIDNLNVKFHTYGTLDPDKNNVIWVVHALTANSDVTDWWNGLFGENKLFNPEKYFIICVNSLGSCYGTTGPSTPSVNKRPLLENFPFFTTRDMAKVYQQVRGYLGITSIRTLIGSSLGGQQAMEWAIAEPEIIKNLVLIATNARHSAYGIAFNESQRLAIYSDFTYGNGKISGGRAGIITARSIAMLSYRSYDGYVQTQTNPGNHIKDHFLASSYQQYQGQKLANRFDAYTYVALTKAMDSHNVGRGKASIESTLQEIQANTLVIGISSDQLFPVNEQKFLASTIPGAVYGEIDSDFGHDGFLIETEQLKNLINDFLLNDFKNHKPTIFKQKKQLA